MDTECAFILTKFNQLELFLKPYFICAFEMLLPYNRKCTFFITVEQCSCSQENVHFYFVDLLES